MFDLNNFNRLDIYKQTTNICNLNKLSDYIFSLMNFKYVYENKKQNFIKHLNLILINLYENYLEDGNRYLAIDRKESKYYKNNLKHNSNEIDEVIIQVCDQLININLVEFHKGIYFEQNRRISRIKANPELIDLFIKFQLNVKDIIQVDDRESILIKDNNKNLINYKDNDIIKSMREELYNYNQLIKDADLSWNGNPIINKFLYRVFNNYGNSGGRFYGSSWQSLNKENRSQILINSKSTVEVDFKAIHPTLLFLKTGNILNFEEFDPYMFKEQKYRKLSKIMLLCMINGDNLSNSIKGARFAIINKYNEYYTYNELEYLSKGICRHNHLIKDFFYKSYGLKLMLEDSFITSLVIKYFTEKEIPVLPIHDSFIIDKDKKEELIYIMKEAFKFNLIQNNYPVQNIEPIVT